MDRCDRRSSLSPVLADADAWVEFGGNPVLGKNLSASSRYEAIA